MDPRIINGWVKQFSNLSSIIGCDAHVDKGMVSWRKSSLENIVEVSLYHCGPIGLIQAHINGLGSFWQSDDLIAPMRLNSTVTGTRTVRRIQKQISETDNFIYVHQEQDTLYLYVTTDQDQSKLDKSYTQIQTYPDQIGMWLTAEIDIITNQLKWYISKAMI
jgi:hypothetical protein